MSELYDLGAERERIVAKIAELKLQRARLSRDIAERRQGDMELSHDEIVQARGHRAYVGGTSPERWYGIGKRQFHFLVSRGLRHDHDFLDVACGSLRLGQYLIPYLDPGRYAGIDGSQRLIDAGCREEVLFGLIDDRRPRFAANYTFDLGFIDGFDMAMAQSLFTHLDTDDIAVCFAKMREKARPGSAFYLTFFEGDEAGNEHEKSHPNRRWEYRFETLAGLAGSAWQVRHIGDWQHPANQMMAVAHPA